MSESERIQQNNTAGTLGNALIITYGNRIPNCPNNSEKENSAQVVEKESIGHKITGVKNDGRQHVKKEGRRCQRRNAGAVGVKEQQADDDTDDDEETGFREDR